MVGNLNITTNIIYYFTSTCFDSFTFFLHFSCMFPAFLLNNIMRSVIKNIVYAKKNTKMHSNTKHFLYLKFITGHHSLYVPFTLSKWIGSDCNRDLHRRPHIEASFAFFQYAIRHDIFIACKFINTTCRYHFIVIMTLANFLVVFSAL